MPEPDRLFLTRAEAIDAIRIDLCQYPVQKPLLRDLSERVLRRSTVETSEIENIWVATRKPGRMKKISWQRLQDRILSHLRETPPELEPLARICARVFDTSARIGHESPTGLPGIWVETGMEGFRCRQCGQCCRHLDYGEECRTEDVARWKRLGHSELVARAVPVKEGERITHYRIWRREPGDDDWADCPWLTPADDGCHTCAIHEIKPEICRQYPGSRKHARMTGCIGFDSEK